MERKHFWGSTVALFLLAASGCAEDPKQVVSGAGGSSGSGAGTGTAGHGGAKGGAAAGGASGSAGEGVSDAGVGPVGGDAGAAGQAPLGEGGEGGRPTEVGGDAGAAGAPVDSSCPHGLTLCSGATECTDLQVGDTQNSVVANCGACGTTCSLGNASATTCTAGDCAPTCNSGFADCNATTGNDGCETDITAVAHCGSCQHACSVNGTTAQACTSGQCVPTCSPRYVDCNANAAPAQDDGCETYLDALDKCGTGCAGAVVACGPTEVCNGGACVGPDGLAVLSTPFKAASQAQRFADLFTAGGINLNGATVTVRVYAPGATNGTLSIYASDTASNLDNNVLRTDLSTLSNGWADLSVHISSAGSFDATSVKQINLEVGTGTGSNLGTDPTLVYVDNVRASNLTVNDTFDTSFGSFVKSSLIVVAGSTIDWAAGVP